ncbi:MAG: hypothetical protein IJ236_06035 [Oscillospiraceae bacterium]|nr:hypothetical protein [Oscillospiraceae bacterium]MBQ9643896.1 hypothetical protein [Lachnospiraceae bacterium]
MKNMIADYETARDALGKRIRELEAEMKAYGLRTMEREKLMRRIECLRQERYNMLLSVIEMRRHGE